MELCFDKLFNTVLSRFMNGKKTYLCFSTVTGGTQENLNIITACVIFFNLLSNHGTSHR